MKFRRARFLASILLGLAFFACLEPTRETIEKPAGPARESKLPLKLIGILTLKDTSRSVASIWSDARQESFPVRAGDDLLSVARIETIDGAKVELTNLKERRLEFLPLSPSRVQAVSEGGKGLVPLSPEEASPHVTISRKDVQACIQALATCARQILAQPYSVNGKLLGWKLSQIAKGSVFEKLGLKENDVLISANGDPVNDVSRIPVWLNDIATVKSVDAGIIRDGRATRVDYLVKD